MPVVPRIEAKPHLAPYELAQMAALLPDDGFLATNNLDLVERDRRESLDLPRADLVVQDQDLSEEFGEVELGHGASSNLAFFRRAIRSRSACRWWERSQSLHRFFQPAPLNFSSAGAVLQTSQSGRCRCLVTVVTPQPVGALAARHP
jgi:hypothetical protein